MPRTGLFLFDENPATYHPVAISWHCSLKYNGNTKKHTTHYVGHCMLHSALTPKNSKLRVDVKRSPETTFLKVDNDQKNFRKTTFGRLPTQHDDAYGKWALIEGPSGS